MEDQCAHQAGRWQLALHLLCVMEKLKVTDAVSAWSYLYSLEDSDQRLSANCAPLTDFKLQCLEKLQKLQLQLRFDLG